MAWSDIFIGDGSQTADEQQANYARQKAELDAKIAARQASGSLTQDQADYYAGNTGGLENQNAAAAQGFGEGLADGWNNVLNAPGKAVGFLGDTLGQALGGIFKNLPWWAYALAAGALFFYLGGGIFLKGSLKRFAK